MKGNNAFGIVDAMTLVLFVSSACLVAAENVSDMNSICSRVSPGQIIASGTNCSVYYICHNGTAYAGKCQENHYFHKDHQACLPVPSASCYKEQVVNVCKGKEIGTLVGMPDTCSNFTYCGTDGPYVLSCTDGYHFNPNKLECVRASDYSCTADINMCKHLRDYVKFGSPADCALYSFCDYGVQYRWVSCGSQVYNVDAAQCVDKSSGYKCPQLQNK